MYGHCSDDDLLQMEARYAGFRGGYERIIFEEIQMWREIKAKRGEQQ
jgi:hypothetical protein